MKKIRREIFYLMVSFILCVCLPGCWDYQAINTRAPIVGIGFDPVKDNPEKFTLCAQIPILSQEASPTGAAQSAAGGASTNFQNFTVEAYSVGEALRALQLQVNRQLDIAQVRVIVFSQNIPRDMMDSLIGQLIRVPKINRLANVLATPDSANGIFSVTGTELSPSDYLAQAFHIRQHGYSLQRELWQYWRDVTQVGVVPTIPIVEPKPRQDGKGDSLVLSGLEVYVNNVPTFDLNSEETFDVNLITGKVRDMALDVPVGNSIASLTNLRAKSHMSCVSQGGRFVLVDRITVSATLAKIATPTPKPLPATNVLKLESDSAAYLKTEITSTLNKLQKDNADVLGFGRIYLQKNPEAESMLKQNWGQMFSSAAIDIQVRVRIDSKGELI